MAIVDSPLLSLGAKKTIGKTLTFLRVKGQNIVRQRVIPANPKTAAQQAQRALLAKAVAEWHSAGLNADDIAALNRWASASFRTQSGYNRQVAERIAWYAAGNDTGIAKKVTHDSFGAGTCSYLCELAIANTGTVHWGTSKTAQPSSAAMVDNADGSFDIDMTSLVDGVTYYFYLAIEDAVPAQAYRTGLYKFTQVNP